MHRFAIGAAHRSGWRCGSALGGGHIARVDVDARSSDNQRDGQPRSPVRPRHSVPAPGGRLDRAYACRVGDGVRGRRAYALGAGRPCAQSPAPGAALSPAPGVRAARAGTAAVDRRSALQPALPHPPHRAAAPRRRGDAEAARRAAVLSAPGPFQAVVGDLARAAHGGQTVCVDRQDPPRARGRDLGR